jgi:hypothetical protein
MHQFFFDSGKRFQASKMRAIDSRINLPPESHFQAENLKIFDFRFNTHSDSPDSGSGKHFQASEMRAIDSPHTISPNRVIFEKKLRVEKT